MTTPPALHRYQQTLQRKMQDGTLLSWTVVHHPPAGFSGRKTIGLIELASGERVHAQLQCDTLVPVIGQRVVPQMQLMQVSPQGLRTYDAVYRLTADVPATIAQKEFPGYILALTGPVGVGRTTVGAILTKVLKCTQTIPLLTTDVRQTQSDAVEILSEKDFASLQKKKAIIVLEKRKHLSGYRIADIATAWQDGKIPMVVAEVEMLQALADHFGRRSILSFGLLPPGRSKRTMLSHLYKRLSQVEHYSEDVMKSYLDYAEDVMVSMKEKKDMIDEVIINEGLEQAVERVKQKVLGVRKEQSFA